MLNRRRFLLSSATMIAAGAASRLIRPAIAADEPTTLRIESRTIEVRGKAAKVFGLRQPNGSQGLTTDVGDPFRVRLENRSGEPTLIHWHGLKPPYRQDGVPDVSGPLIAAGAVADYDFPVSFPGTFWMHSHQGLQEQQMMAAPLIIRDSGRSDSQEVVMMLHDFSFTSPEEILAGLRNGAPSGMMQMGVGASPSSGVHGMKMAGMGHDMATMDHDVMTGRSRAMMRNAEMNGMAMDLNDVVYDAFLANDRTLSDPEVVRVEPGGRVRLRIINGATSSNFVIDLGLLEGKLVDVDGHPIQPVAGSRFPIAAAQRLDVQLQIPKGRAAYPVFSVLEGERKRTGIVLAAAGARVERLGEVAEKPARPLGFSFERSLRAAMPLNVKAADRAHHVDLTGSMGAYDWRLNGIGYSDAKPLVVAAGERVEIEMTNQTMMSHPMHLHGHFFQVVAADGKRFSGAVRDTVLVPPMMTVTIAFDADNPGRWVFHCHNLYHMASGMMTTLEYGAA